MADISKVKLPNGTTYTIKDSRVKGIDSTPTTGSENLITSGGVKTALTNGSVTKLGTDNVGNSHRPIYLNSGVPTQVTDVASEYSGWPNKNHSGLSFLEYLNYIKGPNVFAYPNTDYIDIEYTRDGGTTWLDYGCTSAQKTKLFTTSFGIEAGKKGTTGMAVGDEVRVTIHVGVGTYGKCEYLALRQYCPSACNIKIEYTTYAATTTWVEHTTLTNVTGNPGYSVIPFSKYIFGNSGVHDLRITLIYNGTSSTYVNLSHNIAEIKAFCSNLYLWPSTYASSGRLYTIDENKTAGFPAIVSASSFKKSGGTSSQFLKADGSVDSTSYLPKSGGTMTGYLKWNGDGSLPQDTSPQYFLCINAFASGGTTKWASKANVLASLTGLTSTAVGDSDEPVYWDGTTFVKAGAYPTKASWNYDDTYLKLSGGTMTGAITMPSGSSANDSTKGINFANGSTICAHVGESTLLGLYSNGKIVLRPNGASSGVASNGSVEILNTGVTIYEKVTTEGFIKSGGTSSQFLKADGSVDSNTYLTSSDVPTDRLTTAEIDALLNL